MNTNAALTPRQSQMAELLAWGATKKDVAKSLKVSIRTVETTIRSIFERTEVTKVNELSAWWFCTQFHISFDLSPIKRAVLSVSLLLLIVIHEIHSGDVYRTLMV